MEGQGRQSKDRKEEVETKMMPPGIFGAKIYQKKCERAEKGKAGKETKGYNVLVG